MPTLFNISFVLVFLLLFLGCSNPQNEFSHITDQKAKEIMLKVDEAHGKIINWQKAKLLSYMKNYDVFKEDGSIKKSVDEAHNYEFKPEVKYQIIANDGANTKTTEYQSGKVLQLIDGVLNKEANESSLTSAIFSATYIISLPFKLLDKSNKLQFVGEDILDEGEKVWVIKSTNNDAEGNGDVWWLYFGREDYIMKGYLVKHNITYSYIKNLSTTQYKGFTFPQKRRSYKTDNKRNIKYLQAEYSYSDFRIEY